mmetsp:Transcript_43336/g.65487  ORF Transcript_43336/g.65487 Transcript_43336/m.65487 type:complete len:422 (-) Transcript_43336:1116-2381(-)
MDDHNGLNTSEKRNCLSTQSESKDDENTKEEPLGDAGSHLPTSILVEEDHSSPVNGSSAIHSTLQKEITIPKKNGSHRSRKRVGFHRKQRTSTFIHFSKLSDSKIASIERRAAELLGLPHHCIEPLQLVRYANGQYFSDHHDMGALFEDGSVELAPRSMLSPPRRIVTIFVYLNDLPHVGCGGCTRFPLLCPMDNVHCEDGSGNVSFQSSSDFTGSDCLEGVKCNVTLQKTLDVYPKRGRAVLWCNIDRDGMPDPRTVHSGQPVFDMPTQTSSSPTGVSFPDRENNHDISSAQHQAYNDSTVSESTKNKQFEGKCFKDSVDVANVASSSLLQATESNFPLEQHCAALSPPEEKSQEINRNNSVKNNINLQHQTYSFPPTQSNVRPASSNMTSDNRKTCIGKNKPTLPSVVKYGMNIWACEE